MSFPGQFATREVVIHACVGVFVNQPLEWSDKDIWLLSEGALAARWLEGLFSCAVLRHDSCGVSLSRLS